jgi:hypothetical protein
LEAFKVQLRSLQVCVGQLLVDDFLIGVGDDRDGEVQQNKVHDEQVREPSDPDDGDHRNSSSSLRLVLLQKLMPVIVIWW